MVPAPFDSVGEELRAKMEVASEPKEEAEEEDTEGVDLMRAIMHEQWPKRDELRNFMRLRRRKLAYRMMAFLSSVDKPGWWWVQHTCMRRTSWSPRLQRKWRGKR